MKKINFEKKMLQRPQTLLLLLFCAVATANALFFPLEARVFSHLLNASSIYASWVSLIFVLIVVLNIFLYKNRPMQIRINKVVWLLFTLFWGSYVYFVVKEFNTAFSTFLPDLVLAFIGEVCLLYANRFIRKDENLIRSMDRIR